MEKKGPLSSMSSVLFTSASPSSTSSHPEARWLSVPVGKLKGFTSWVLPSERAMVLL